MNSRQKELLIDLLNREGFVSAHYLAKIFQVSTKTIYKDLSLLFEILERKNLTLVKQPRYGIIIEGDKLLKSKFLFDLRSNTEHSKSYKDYSERENYYLKKLVLDAEKLDVIDLAVELYISESSVRRDLEKLDFLLKKSHIKLKKTDGKFLIDGNETEIRKFFRSFLIDKFDLIKGEYESMDFLFSSFSLSDLTPINSLISHKASLFTFTIPENLKIYLSLDLLINAIRIKKQHFVQDNEFDLGDDLEKLAVFPLASELLSNVTKIPINLLSDAEVNDICLTLLSIGYVTEKSDNSEYRLLTKKLIEKVSELSGVEFTNDDYLSDMIANHMRPMIYRLKNNININNQTTEEIKKRYSILFNIVWMASKFISDQFNIKFYDSEITFLTIYFQIAVEKIQKPLLIYIICPHGLATSELIINSVRKIVPHYDRIQKLELSSLTEEKAKSADMIISSVELNNIDVPYIWVSPVLTQSEIDIIQSTYHTLSDGNRRILSVMTSDHYFNQSVINELIKNRIFLNQNISTSEEAILFLTQTSAKKNRKSKDYHKSILKREELGSTSVYTGIALPHADPNSVKVSQLSFITLREPIQWGSNRVSVVMLIAIKEGEEERYKDALVYLYSKIDHHNFIETLANAKTKQQFLNILLGKERK